MLRFRPVANQRFHRTFGALGRALLAVLLVTAWSSRAHAARRDATVLRLDKSAMNQDYFETRFNAAARKLEHALALCGRSACSARVRARVERDLGVVYVVGLHDSGRGIAAFKKAVADDPNIQLDPAFVTPEVRAAFAAAHGGGGGAAVGQGGLQLRRVTEQRVRRPVPIYVEVSEGSPTQVRLYFKRDDQEHYRSVTMKRVGDGYGGLIPCDMVRHTGTVDYFVRAFSRDQAIAQTGSDHQPLQVDIVEELDEEPPHWPDHSPPAHCGGESSSSGCQSDSDCASGQRCNDSGQCVAGHAAPSGPSKFLLSLNIEQDAAIIGGNNVCTEQSQLNDGFACFRNDGVQYHGNPVIGRDDSIGTGMAFATTRILIGGDYLLGGHFTVGLRLGYVLRGGGPRPDGGSAFQPFHVEARVAYFTRNGAFDNSGFTPYFFVSGGLAQVDAKNQLVVFENTNKPPPPYQLDNPPEQTLDAWRKMGTSFAGPGVGIYYALGKKTGLSAEIRYMALFPTSGSALSLSVGFAYGL